MQVLKFNELIHLIICSFRIKDFCDSKDKNKTYGMSILKKIVSDKKSIQDKFIKLIIDHFIPLLKIQYTDEIVEKVGCFYME